MLCDLWLTPITILSRAKLLSLYWHTEEHLNVQYAACKPPVLIGCTGFCSAGMKHQANHVLQWRFVLGWQAGDGFAKCDECVPGQADGEEVATPELLRGLHGLRRKSYRIAR
jgi:hypothetical protein